MDQSKEQASFVSDFKKNQEKRFEELVTNRKVRLRSSIFDLPEFEGTPLISCIVLVNAQAGLSNLESFIKDEMPNKDLEMIFLISKGLEISKLARDRLAVHRFDLSEANLSTWMNQTAIHSKGKIIGLMPSIENLQSAQLLEVGKKIENSEKNSVQILESKTELTGVAMTRDLYYLAHGLDELIENVNVSHLDLTLRVEMLGGQIEGSGRPRSDLTRQAEKNVRSGRLTVNHGLDTFISAN